MAGIQWPQQAPCMIVQEITIGQRRRLIQAIKKNRLYGGGRRQYQIVHQTHSVPRISLSVASRLMDELGYDGYALSASAKYNNMHAAAPSPPQLPKVRPAEYLAASFKAYVLEHVLLTLLRKALLPSLSRIKAISSARSTLNSHRNRQKKVRMRTQEQEASFEFASGRFQSFGDSLHQLTPHPQSPFRQRGAAKNFKTQYVSNGYSIGHPLGGEGELFGSGQRRVGEFFYEPNGQFVSPYRKKDNVSIVQANYSTERMKNGHSSLSIDGSQERYKVEDSKKSTRMREKMKIGGMRLMVTTLKFACNKLQRSLFQRIQRISLIRLKKRSAQRQQNTSKLLRQLQTKEGLLKRSRKTVQKYAKDLLLYQKCSIFIKMEALVKYQLRASFLRMKQTRKGKEVAMRQNSDDGQQYTIVYTNDEQISGPSVPHGEGLALHLTLPAEWERGQKIEDSHRSRATNSSAHNE